MFEKFGRENMIDSSRREMLGGVFALSAFALLSGCGGMKGAAALKGGDAFFSAEEMGFLTSLADTIIPATDTPGAVLGKVPDTLQSLLTSWANDETRGRWRTNLDLLKAELDKGGNFAKADAANRAQRLGKIDKAVFADPKHKLAGYRDIKGTIAQAYYLSEPGATKELRYEPVPGDWRGSEPVGRNWAA
jgi:gluconate 2-dehydrogenase gamma chain